MHYLVISIQPRYISKAKVMADQSDYAEYVHDMCANTLNKTKIEITLDSFLFPEVDSEVHLKSFHIHLYIKLIFMQKIFFIQKYSRCFLFLLNKTC